MNLSVKNKNHIKSRAKDLELYIANTIYITDKLLNINTGYPHVEYRYSLFNTNIIIVYGNFEIDLYKNIIIFKVILKKGLMNKIKYLDELEIKYELKMSNNYPFVIIWIPYENLDILKQLILDVHSV